jgi:hypothetical protein
LPVPVTFPEQVQCAGRVGRSVGELVDAAVSSCPACVLADGRAVEFPPGKLCPLSALRSTFRVLPCGGVLIRKPRGTRSAGDFHTPYAGRDDETEGPVGAANAGYGESPDLGKAFGSDPADVGEYENVADCRWK